MRKLSQHPAAVKAREMRARPEVKKRLQEYRDKNREKSRAYSRIWTKKWRDKNRQQARDSAARWRAENPASWQASVRKSRIKRVYRISVAEYDELLAKPCAICGGKAQALDHDHEDDALRDALCRGCNQGLGNFKESPRRLREAAVYIEYWKSMSGYLPEDLD